MEPFDKKVEDFCERQHYTRTGAITEEEFSQVAFRLHGAFFLSSMSLAEVVNVANCTLLARLRLLEDTEGTSP